jgi:hypothetical protein
MPHESRPPDKQQPLELTPDFLYESRHEFVELRRITPKTRQSMCHNPLGSFMGIELVCLSRVAH